MTSLFYSEFFSRYAADTTIGSHTRCGAVSSLGLRIWSTGARYQIGDISRYNGRQSGWSLSKMQLTMSFQMIGVAE